MIKKICVVTGARSDFGLMRLLMDEIKNTNKLELQIIALGMHFSIDFGETYKEIEDNGFVIDRKIETLLDSDSAVGCVKSMGLVFLGMADALDQIKPDCVVVLGDRSEIFSAASAAATFRIPVIHIHGGEITEGAIDDSFRHAITKLASLHFVAADTYRQRVVQMGENPKNVHVVGGLGVDLIKNTALLDRNAVERKLGIKFGERNLLVTFHPVTNGQIGSMEQFSELLDALATVKDVTIIFTLPNSDEQGRQLMNMVKKFVNQNPHTYVFESMGQLLYLSCLALVDGVVGNSSSGILESPAMKKGSINIGDRQSGRIRADSVIDCLPNSIAITKAIELLLSRDHQNRSMNTISPYGEGGASKMIVDILKDTQLGDLPRKSFFDIKGNLG